jgi:flagellar biosynthesis protein FlhB
MKLGKFEILFRHGDYDIPVPIPVSVVSNSPDNTKLDITLNMDTKVRMTELIFAEEYRRIYIENYQVIEETSTTFNIFLLGMTAVITGMSAMADFIFKDTDYFTKTFLELIATIVLVIVVIISLAFYRRFIDLVNTKRENIKALKKLRDFFIKNLNNQLPETDLQDIFSQSLEENRVKVPPFITFVVPGFGSVTFATAAYIIIQGLLPFTLKYIFPAIEQIHIPSNVSNLFSSGFGIATFLYSLLKGYKPTWRLIANWWQNRSRTKKRTH